MVFLGRESSGNKESNSFFFSFLFYFFFSRARGAVHKGLHIGKGVKREKVEERDGNTRRLDEESGEYVRDERSKWGL